MVEEMSDMSMCPFFVERVPTPKQGFRLIGPDRLTWVDGAREEVLTLQALQLNTAYLLGLCAAGKLEDATQGRRGLARHRHYLGEVCRLAEWIAVNRSGALPRGAQAGKNAVDVAIELLEGSRTTDD